MLYIDVLVNHCISMLLEDLPYSPLSGCIHSIVGYMHIHVHAQKEMLNTGLPYDVTYTRRHDQTLQIQFSQTECETLY